MIDDHLSMADLTPEVQAGKALRHILSRINRDPAVGWYLGIGTESFALATEAFAALCGVPVRQIREQFAPLDPQDPVDQALIDATDTAPRLGCDDVETLAELERHHEQASQTLTLAAATTGNGKGLELQRLAAGHDRWASELTVLKLRAKGLTP